jgi:proteasome assembly chaperone 3
MAHLSPKTLLGGSASERETMGQLYATQIASSIVTRNPEEKRTVLIGFGLRDVKVDREVFFDIIDLVMGCL